MGLRTAGVAGLVAAVGASTALAALPLNRDHYRGHGPLYTNKTGVWKKGTTETVSFRTARTGRTLLRFRGNFATWCGGSGFYVTARELYVSRRGIYSYRFRLPNRTATGKVNGRDYYWIYGRFFDGGHKAYVNYLFDYVASGTRVRRPYDTAHPARLGCASWVRGVARAG